MPSIWGADASEFNPDRFDRDEKRPVVPGVYGNLVTFLGGPHNCIGHRLTILEMKVMVYALIRNFKFNLPPNMPAMTRSWLIIQRPVVVGEEHKGPQMPLIVSPA
jgi:cytochrome P450